MNSELGCKLMVRRTVSPFRIIPQAVFFAGLVILSMSSFSGCQNEADNRQTTTPPPSTSTENGATHSNSPNKDTADKSPAPDANSSTVENRTADQILRDMETAYRNATSYSDKAQIEIRFERDGVEVGNEIPCSVAFTRPNKLRMDCYGANVVCDGKDFWATAQSTPNIVAKTDAPQMLDLNDIVGRDPRLEQELNGLAGLPVQPYFLLKDNALAEFMAEGMVPKLLQPARIGEQLCNRVEFSTPAGPLVFWIDQRQNLLRRMEMPATHLTQILEAQGPVKNATLRVEFHHAQLNQPVSEAAFTFEVPENTSIVTSLAETPPTPIAPRTEPAKLKLTKRWTAEGLKNPGNILVVEGEPAPRVFVIDGIHTVVELDHEGKTVARHELDIPEENAISTLRTAVDKSGKRYFVAMAAGQPQLFLFDENWNKLLSFPRPEDQATSNVGDVQIVDLDADGTPELYVGYWGDLGLQKVSLDAGQVQREPLNFVLRLATTEPDAEGRRRLLGTNSMGTIAAMSSDFKREKDIAIPNQPLHTIAAADLEGRGQNHYVGLVGSPTYDNTLLGVDLDGRELWSYVLPKGVHGRPIEMIAFGDVADSGTAEWIIAGPDGSIHILDSEGNLIDKFNHGAALAGVNATKVGDDRVFLISSVFEKPTDAGVGTLEAWTIGSTEPTAPLQQAESESPDQPTP